MTWNTTKVKITDHQLPTINDDRVITREVVRGNLILLKCLFLQSYPRETERIYSDFFFGGGRRGLRY